MTKKILLDSSPLGRLTNPKKNIEVHDWFRAHVIAGTQFFISEANDYELRRSFIQTGAINSIKRLEQIESLTTYLPITTQIMRNAAVMWGQARKKGHLTADIKEVDFDVIIAAHALEQDAIIATENVGHLSHFVEAYDWRVIIQ